MSETTAPLVTIEANRREQVGKGYGRKLRRAGKIAGVLHEKGKTTLLDVEPKFLSKAWKSPTKTFNLSFEGKVTLVKIQELQIDVVKRLPLHVDLVPTK